MCVCVMHTDVCIYMCMPVHYMHVYAFVYVHGSGTYTYKWSPEEDIGYLLSLSALFSCDNVTH